MLLAMTGPVNEACSRGNHVQVDAGITQITATACYAKDFLHPGHTLFPMASVAQSICAQL